MKKIVLFFFAGLLVASCSKEAKDTTASAEQGLVSVDEIKDMVENQLSQGDIFYWSTASDEVVYSAGMHADSIFSIGYTTDSGYDLDAHIHQLDLKSEKWVAAKKKIADLIVDYESKLQGKKLNIEDLSPFGEEDVFPQIIVRVTSQDLITKLRSLPTVRYVEPLGFSIEDLSLKTRSGQGCDGSPDYNINNADYTTASPGTKVPWNFPLHDIDDAWASSQGDNIRIAILDTGASDSQDNLGSQFTSGWSGGRNIIKASTIVSGSWWWASLDSPHDDCGHGTSMAGYAAAPRGTDGNAVGVAYKADLLTINCSQDVIISTSNERKGVRDAMKMAANRSDTKIISISLGTPFYSGTVADGVNYAYNRGKLIFAAAGTSLSWTSWYPVIFPATMSQCRAVTGVRDGEGMQRCVTCHSGKEVDFVITMERANDDDRTSISLASSTNQPKYTGGSSCATATTAGIAALVWAQNTSASREDILQAMKDASQYYPSRHPEFGWGKVNAAGAVGNL